MDGPTFGASPLPGNPRPRPQANLVGEVSFQAVWRAAFLAGIALPLACALACSGAGTSDPAQARVERENSSGRRVQPTTLSDGDGSLAKAPNPDGRVEGLPSAGGAVGPGPAAWDDLSWLAEQRPPADMSTLREPLKVEGVEVLDEVDGTFSKIRIQQEGTRREMLFVAPSGRTHRQSQVETQRSYELHSPYAKAIVAALLLRPSQRRVLLVGLGGGTLVHFFQHFVPQMEIAVVEIDPQVIEMATKWFAIEPRGEGPGSLRLHEADALTVFDQDPLAQKGEAEQGSEPRNLGVEGLFDAIYLDAYLIEGAAGTDSDGVPRDQKSDAFLRSVRARLTAGGVAVFNVHFTPKWEAYRDSIGAVFEYVAIIEPVKAQHRLVVASAEPLPGEEVTRARAATLGRSRARFAAVLLEGMSRITTHK